MNCALVRVCILHASYEGTTGPFAEVDAAACDPRPYLRGHEVEERFLRKATAAEEVRALADRGFDVFLNLCDGAADEDRAGLGVVAAGRSGRRSPARAHDL